MPPGREPDRLPVIAACGGDDSGDRVAPPRQSVEEHETAANLEGANGCLVLVLHPDVGARTHIEKRPAPLWRRRHRSIHDGRRRFEIRQGRHQQMLPFSHMFEPGPFRQWPPGLTTFAKATVVRRSFSGGGRPGATGVLRRYRLRA